MNLSNPDLWSWHPEYSVGSGEMDDQHRGLLAIIDELHGSLARGDGDERVGAIIAALARYIGAHFAAEEQLMLDHGYPDDKYIAHCRAHEALLDQVRGFDAAVRRGERHVATEMLPFLVGDWLVNHILVTDKDYSEYLVGASILS